MGGVQMIAHPVCGFQMPSIQCGPFWPIRREFGVSIGQWEWASSRQVDVALGKLRCVCPRGELCVATHFLVCSIPLWYTILCACENVSLGWVPWNGIFGRKGHFHGWMWTHFPTGYQNAISQPRQQSGTCGFLFVSTWCYQSKSWATW